MMPVLPPGTVVYGWRWFRRLKPGDIVIFFHNDKEKIKRIEKITDGKVYVVGDHQDVSTDSRHFGWLDKEAVVAKLIWPRAPKNRAEGFDSP
ncbi:MAG TPA: S26 family signal peptidase [Candidatus Limnocylindria bacterium]|nr:S26 family signal peptidase [Candidatus Limnocylindria bacterium]